MIPGVPLNFSAGGGGPSGASANNGVSNPFSIPFVFDNSGWVINNRGSGSMSATGSTGAAAGNPNAGASALPGNGSIAGIPIHLIMIAAGVWLMFKR